MGTYLTGKLLHGGLSALLLHLLLPLLGLKETAGSYLVQQTQAVAALDFSRCLTLSAGTAWGTWIVFFLLFLWAAKKSGGKIRREPL